MEKSLSPLKVMFLLFYGANIAYALPPGFVYLDAAAPAIDVDLRYAGDENFVGSPIEGYHQPRAILTREAAAALQTVQKDLQRFGLGVKVFDAYRPQRAVNHFVRWAKDLQDIQMKTAYYPNVNKINLFKDGYIAEKSGHSRGSTVDVTLISYDAKSCPHELDMGSGFDYFDPSSRPEFPGLSTRQHTNRMLLKSAMKRRGFKPYSKEWWHFTLVNEPFPDTYFDFVIE